MFTKNAFNGKADPVADSIKAIADSDYALKMEALKGDQVKLDKNKNNKLDADDFKILRGKKKVNEADEKPRSAGSVFDKDVAKSFEKKKPGESTGHESKKTSTGTQYTKKAPKPEETNESFSSFKDKLKSGAKKVLAKVGGGSDEDQRKRLQKNMGIPQTGKPNHAKYNEEVEFDLEAIDPALVEEFMQTEEFEQLDELSKDTLRSYRVNSIGRAGNFEKRGYEAAKKGGGAGSDKADKLFNKSDLVASARKSAQEKLRKEEVEEINELKKSTLASYVDKAKQDNKDYADSRRSGDEEESRFAKNRFVKRNTGIGAAQNRLKKEEVEQIDELSKDTLKSYQDKAMKTPPSKNGNWVSRISGIARSAEKLKKEEVDQIEERELTADEKAEREKNVKGMKKNIAGFKSRYGTRAKEVMYATATKMAKEDVESIDEGERHTLNKKVTNKINRMEKLISKGAKKQGRTDMGTIMNPHNKSAVSKATKKASDAQVSDTLKRFRKNKD